MERLIINKGYPKKFVYSFLPRVIKQIATQKIYSRNKSDMNKYLVDQYQLSICELIPVLNNLKIDEYEGFYILHYDVEGNIRNKNKKSIRIKEVLHLLSYGNLSIRGLHIIDSTFDYVAGNIRHLYRLFLIEERAKMQENLGNGVKSNGNKILR